MSGTGLRTLAEPTGRSDRVPRVSVVVPTHDRAPRLERLLESLSAQTLAAEEFEVVVVDDASGDQTPALLRRVAADSALAVRALRRDLRGGPAHARNDGWRAARAELVAFTDDDCVADPGWLAEGVRAAAASPGSIVQGTTGPDPAEVDRLGPFSRSLWVERLGPHFQTCNVFYPRALLERLGGFDAEAFPFVGEDTDLAWRAIGSGAEVRFAPAARVHHAVSRLGPVGSLRLAARWTPSIRLFRRHPRLRREHLVAGVFWKGSHRLLVEALVGLALPRRWLVLKLMATLPYARHLLERGRVDGGGPLAAPWYALYDLVELAAVARGAARFRTLVL